MAAEALISPNVMLWARERAAIPAGTLAERLGVDEAAIAAWETGAARPTFRQAEKFAALAHVPFGYLFLSAPPEETTPIPDLRTTAGGPRRRFSADFLDLIRDVMFKRDWFRQYLLDHGQERLAFVGRFDRTARIETVARDIRGILERGTVDDSSTSWDHHLSRLFGACEAAGIWVMRTGTVAGNTHRTLSVSDFRGFAIADDIAPIIMINGRDARAAQAFTLAHELAHIWLGQSGISDPMLNHPRDESAGIERTCDAIAAEVLVPRATFLAEWQDTRDLTENAHILARRFKVSQVVIARRALDLGKISRDEHQAFFEKERQAWLKLSEGGGGNFYATAQARNGKRFARAVVNSAMSGNLLLREAGQLLDLKPATVIKLHERMVHEP